MALGAVISKTKWTGIGLALRLSVLALCAGVVMAACETTSSTDCDAEPDAAECVTWRTVPADTFVSGDTFADCPGCPQMAALPAGSSRIGDLRLKEPYGDTDEEPDHAVSFSEFAIGVYEVTFDEWLACVADGGCRGYAPFDESWGPARRPVIHVSWDDAQAYVAWLSARTDRTYRLPSEEEWEYAARANTTTSYWSGKTLSTAEANFDGNLIWNGSKKGGFAGQTLPVGSFAPNAFGLYDVHGNVSEWTSTCYVEFYDEPAAAAGSECSHRTLRSGSWIDGPFFARAAWRHPVAAGEQHNFTGFRVARTIDRVARDVKSEGSQ